MRPRGIHRTAELARRFRVWRYKWLSSQPEALDGAVICQPVLCVGSAPIRLGEGVQFGWPHSPDFHAGYGYLEADGPGASIEVGDRTEFNNGVTIKSAGGGIRIGADCLFGAFVEIFDSDFHDLDPAARKTGTPATAAVAIGDNVFVGMGARILKGVTIGDDSVVGAGSVVTASIPAGVVAAGNPARVVRSLEPSPLSAAAIG